MLWRMDLICFTNRVRGSGSVLGVVRDGSLMSINDEFSEGFCVGRRDGLLSD